MRHQKTYFECMGLTLLGILASYGVIAWTGGFSPQQRQWAATVLLLAVAAIPYFSCYRLAWQVSALFDRQDPTGGFRDRERSFSLPVRTQTLVLAPMAVGVLLVLSLWAPYCLLAILPLHSGVPVLLPMLALCLMVVANYSCRWLIGVKWLFAPCMMIATIPALAAPFLVVSDADLVLPELITALLIPTAALAACRVAPSARNSTSLPNLDHATAGEEKRRGRRRAAGPERIFKTALAAQCWFRMRSRFFLSAIYMPVLWCLMLKVMPYIMGSGNPFVIENAESVTDRPLYMLCLVFFAMGPQPLEVMPKHDKGRLIINAFMDPFLAVRPMSTATIVGTRMLSGLVPGALVTAELAFLALFGVIAPPSSILSGLGAHGTRASLPLLVTAVILFPIFLVSLQAGSMTLGLLPERVRKLSLAWWLLALFVVLLVTSRILFRDVWRTEFWLGHGFPSRLGITVLLLLAVKAALIVPGSMRLLQSGLGTRRQLGIGAGLWVTSFAALSGLAYAVLPPGSVTLSGVALVVALLVPANRIIWHIVLLDRTRHQ